MGFSRQEYWTGFPYPPLGDLPNPGIELKSPVSPALAGGFFTTSATWETLLSYYLFLFFPLKKLLKYSWFTVLWFLFGLVFLLFVFWQWAWSSSTRMSPTLISPVCIWPLECVCCGVGLQSLSDTEYILWPARVWILHSEHNLRASDTPAGKEEKDWSVQYFFLKCKVNGAAWLIWCICFDL